MLNSPERIRTALRNWYDANKRELPWRGITDPYKIWICEIVFQQTRISQGLNHYENFVKRFPDVKTLSEAKSEEVMLHWKGLGYYSRALNIHKASKQIMQDFDGVFPKNYDDILSLKGIGKYTAAAISSICFLEQRPAIDGNFYRVLSRIFADDFDISLSTAFDYFSVISKKVIYFKNKYRRKLKRKGSPVEAAFYYWWNIYSD